MDASFGLGQSKQMNENQQEGESARRGRWVSSVYGLQKAMPQFGQTKGAVAGTAFVAEWFRLILS